MANDIPEANDMAADEHPAKGAAQDDTAPEVGVATTTDSAVETASTIAPTETSSQDGSLANPPPIPSSSWFNASRRPKTAPGPRAGSIKNRRLFSDSDHRRDSGHAPPRTTSKSSRGTVNGSLTATSSVPTVVGPDDDIKPTKLRRKASNARPRTAKARVEGATDIPTLEPFVPLTMSIPTGSFDDLTRPGALSFSKRGSVLLGGRRANEKREWVQARAGSRDLGLTLESLRPLSLDAATVPDSEAPLEAIAPATTVPPPGSPRPLATPRGRIMSTDEADLSKKVRSLYDSHGADYVDPHDIPALPNQPALPVDIEKEEEVEAPAQEEDTEAESSNVQLAPADSVPQIELTPSKSRTEGKEPREMAGGIEDWEDIDGHEVDRYGFIIPKKEFLGSSPPPPGIQRISTLLQIASETPRRARSMRRIMSSNRSSRSVNTPNSLRRKPSFRSARPPTSIRSGRTSMSTSSQGPLRFVSNRLPHHKERKLLDEAGDMLTLPPGLAAIEEEKEGGHSARMMKQREWGREEKWRRMAKSLAKPLDGGGMSFEFNIKDPKLISRTWKGIPDKWRATAWHAFLSASAKKTPGTFSDEELIKRFNLLQLEDCAEDMQIDVDVPRTISLHVMFRRRYRGGQRLLFRVLHALTLHFPEVGYVQGMASLAATLLCYYDEEKAFVMMVRMWDHRGLRQLYAHGFDGLMNALSDFEKNWLGEGDVGKKLVSSDERLSLWSLALSQPLTDRTCR
jgi:hypothetical protein